MWGVGWCCHLECFPITKEYVLSEFRDLFEGIGKLPGGKYHIQLKPDAQPVQHPPRAVTEKKKVACKEELERLCSSGIIEPVQGHTDWINSVVPVSKPDGSIRLCIDTQDLNKSIKRNQYYTKTTVKLKLNSTEENILRLLMPSRAIGW